MRLCPNSQSQNYIVKQASCVVIYTETSLQRQGTVHDRSALAYYLDIREPEATLLLMDAVVWLVLLLCG